MKDYRNYKDGKYPLPIDRCVASDFPAIEELFVYGEDFDIPVSFEDLRGKYNEDERNPLALEDLKGYRVPPLGLHTIGKNGSGFQPKRDKRGGGWIYPAGTFRDNLYKPNALLGPTTSEMVASREEKRKDAQTNAVMAFLSKKYEGEELDVILTDVSKSKEERAVQGMLLWALQMIDDKGAAREAVNSLKWFAAQLSQKEGVINRHREANEMTFDQALDFVSKVREKGILDPVEIKTIEGEIEDVEE